MSLKKLYTDALLGETLREFRKGRKYIGGDEDETGEQVGENKTNPQGHEFGPNSPRLADTAGAGGSEHLS